MNKKAAPLDPDCEYVAYAGFKFTIEWYYNENRECEVLEYYKKLDLKDRVQIMTLFQLMGDQGEIKNKEKFRNEGEQIFAFKAGQERYLCFFIKGKKIIVTNAFRKKMQKLPVGERNKAVKKRESYLQRCTEGEYYG